MGDGGRNKILHLLGLVMLSRWLRSCKGSFPPFPSHSCFLPFLFSLSSLLEEARLAPALEVLGPLALGEDRHHQG